jgi:uncharacterized protein DUF4124
LLLLFLAASAHADLYRWVDPATGTVTYSNVPPADPRVSPQVVPYSGPLPPKAPPPPPIAKPAPTASVPALETEFNALYAQLASVPPEDFRKASEALRRQMQTYEALRSQLDQLDPAGAPRRAAASLALAERVRQGLGAGK